MNVELSYKEIATLVATTMGKYCDFIMVEGSEENRQNALAGALLADQLAKAFEITAGDVRRLAIRLNDLLVARQELPLTHKSEHV